MVINITDCGITNSIIPPYIVMMVLLVVCVCPGPTYLVCGAYGHTLSQVPTHLAGLLLATRVPALVTIMWVFCSIATNSYVLFHVTIRDIIFFQFGEPINTTGCLVSGRGVR